MSLKNSFKLRSQAEMDAEQKFKEEEKIRQHWLIVERARKIRELYEIKEISTWMYLGPFLGMFVAAIAGLMIWLSGESDVSVLWWAVGIGVAPLMLLGFTSSVNDSWEASVVAKKELEKTKNDDDNFSFSDSRGNERVLNGHKYKYGYIYTDSTISYWLYNVTKLVMGLSTIGFGILASILLFMWLGSISIAPTTIIIFLLVIIIINQNK